MYLELYLQMTIYRSYISGNNMERTNESVTPTDRLVCMRVECLLIRHGCLHGRLDVWLIGCLNGRRYVWIVFLLFRLLLRQIYYWVEQKSTERLNPPFPLIFDITHDNTHETLNTRHNTQHTTHASHAPNTNTIRQSSSRASIFTPWTLFPHKYRNTYGRKGI